MIPLERRLKKICCLKMDVLNYHGLSNGMIPLESIFNNGMNTISK